MEESCCHRRGGAGVNKPAFRLTRRAWLLTLCCLAGVGYCQERYPSRPVRIIVAYPAGGAVDPPARILAQQLSVQTGQQFVVENRPGAGGNLGEQRCADGPQGEAEAPCSDGAVLCGGSLAERRHEIRPQQSLGG